jgi:hypothetical protein
MVVRRHSRGDQGVPDHGPGVVVAVQADRRAQRRVAGEMPDATAAGPAVGAAGLGPGGPAHLDPAAPDAAGVDGAEAGGGEGDEQPRMPADGLGDAFAASQAPLEELVGVGPVDLGTGWAAGRPAGAARLEQHPVRLPGRVDHRGGFPAGAVDVVDATDQPDRALAVAGGPDLPLPLCVVIRVACAGAQVGQEPVAEWGVVGFLVGPCGLF